MSESQEHTQEYTLDPQSKTTATPKARPSPNAMLMPVFVIGLLIGVLAGTGMLLLFSDDRSSLHSDNTGEALMGQYDAAEEVSDGHPQKMRLAHHDMQSSREGGKPGKIYFLDAGSYKSLKEADAVKAKLALLGIESRVEPRQVDNEKWYRLKVGPYFSNVDVNVDKAELAMNGIRSELLQTPALPRGTFN